MRQQGQAAAAGTLQPRGSCQRAVTTDSCCMGTTWVVRSLHACMHQAQEDLEAPRLLHIWARLAQDRA